MVIYWLLLLLITFGIVAIRLLPKGMSDAMVMSGEGFGDISYVTVREEVLQIMRDDVWRVPISVTLWDQNAEMMPDHTLHDDTSSSKWGPPLIRREYEILDRMKYTTVFTFSQDPLTAIVYRQACLWPEEIDKAVVDFWFLNHLKHTEVVPRVYDMSQPLDTATIDIRLLSSPTAKIIVRQCSDTKLVPQVRYTVMERVKGKPIDMIYGSHEDSKLPIAVAALYGIEIVTALRTIHEMNVIHGDIHPSNVMIDVNGKAKLIDFERAKLLSPSDLRYMAKKNLCGQTFSTRMHRLRIHQWSTPWEAQRCVSSFRDDMYRALYVIASMMYGYPLISFFYDLTRGEVTEDMQRQWVEVKTHSNQMFNIDTSGNERLPISCRRKFLIADIFGQGNTQVVDSVSYMFERLTNLVMYLEIDARPKYDAIISVLAEILEATG